MENETNFFLVTVFDAKQDCYMKDFFDLITFGIRFVLDGLEIIFVKTPWIVIGSFLILLTALSAGISTAIYTSGFLFYIGLLQKTRIFPRYFLIYQMKLQLE